ncbi:26S proteasome regulatory subunit RPN11 [Astathelohania contejeani]|uniref:26S proteasome regulatory subunit RPN11 n=1 Tax=Astathelohania contejeani TaxID=164912 RepID=A0ABQ7I1X9_9MICR|nr:26S proteasome regulatory subunit RPN11 [Thelohania contejeani]
MSSFANLDSPDNLPDTSETVQISALALLKMLKHGRAGVPMEVMGLMLGDFVDEYTIHVVDVFAMPQSGTGVTVEAVDPVFQTKMMEILNMTGRKETVVGWYHSHPGFGCWLSSVDISTQQSFEQLCKRAVAVVIDPIQSVKGKVVIDAFRLINGQMAMLGVEPRQITSNLGYLTKPSLVSMLHGLNRHYYAFNINYRKHELEQKMLLNLHRKTWADNLRINKLKDVGNELIELSKNFIKAWKEEQGVEDLELFRVGKIDYRRRLLEKAEEICGDSIVYNLLYSIHYSIFNE